MKYSNVENVNREYIRKLVRDIEEAIRIILEDTSKPFNMLTRSEISEVRYYLIVLVEALVALCYHIARRVCNVEVETPTKTFRLLVERGLLTEEEYSDFVKLVRLRNLLVHRYWTIDDRLIYENVKRNFRHVLSFVERVKHVFQL